MPETDNKKPQMYDLSLFYQMGINPKTGLPVKMGAPNDKLKSAIKAQLRIKDEQEAVNKFVWYNLPGNISSQELEKMLYYKGQLCFFYFKELDQFFFMPYALDGTLDFYGRYNSIKPLPWTNGTEEKSKNAPLTALLSTKKLNCVYGMKFPEDLKEEDFYTSAVLLHDYTKQLSQTIISRQVLNDPILDVMAEIIPFLRTSLLAGTGIKGIRVNDADQQDNVHDASRGMLNAALNAEPFVAMIGNVEFQELTNGSTLKAEEFMMSFQSLDNYRLSLHGIQNGGVFEKKAHLLNAEQQMNESTSNLVLQDGLSIRQNFCNIVNSIWGLGIWCEPSETEIMADMNGDGMLSDENTNGEHSGIESDGDGGNDEQ